MKSPDAVLSVSTIKAEYMACVDSVRGRVCSLCVKGRCLLIACNTVGPVLRHRRTRLPPAITLYRHEGTGTSDSEAEVGAGAEAEAEAEAEEEEGGAFAAEEAFAGVARAFWLLAAGGTI